MAFASAVMSLFPAPPRSQQKTTPLALPNAENVTGITPLEKQAMIDDLQLEISKRARGLRSIYNEQARQLRETIERRIHRIPPRMRSKTMGDLADERNKQDENIKLASVATEPALMNRSNKRSSATAFTSEDKENGYTDLENQKKRPKVAKATHSSALKASVLSPRSHNSRQLTGRIGSPEKPVLKSKSSTATLKPRPASRAVSRQGTTAAGRKPAAKKAGNNSETESRDSEGSTTSAVTTIVKKSAESKRGIAARTVTTKADTTSTRKRAAPTKVEFTAPVTRSLRKRG